MHKKEIKCVTTDDRLETIKEFPSTVQKDKGYETAEKMKMARSLITSACSMQDNSRKSKKV